MPPDATHFKLHLIRDFIDSRAREEIVDELDNAAANPATIYGRGDSASVDARTRKTELLVPDPKTVATITSRL